MRSSAAARRAILPRTFAAVVLSVFLSIGAQPGSALAAAETDDVTSQTVTISVTIDVFDPCTVEAPGCAEPGRGGDLATTGIAGIGLPLGAGALLAAIGAAVYARAPRRRRASR